MRKEKVWKDVQLQKFDRKVDGYCNYNGSRGYAWPLPRIFEKERMVELTYFIGLSFHTGVESFCSMTTTTYDETFGSLLEQVLKLEGRPPTSFHDLE